MLDHGDAPAEALLDPRHEAPVRAHIHPQMTQAGKEAAHGVEDELAAVAVLDISRGHHRFQDQPFGIHEQMPLAPLHLLAGVVTASALFRPS